MTAEPAPVRPTGTVTFLFTDIEGSTRLLHRLGERYAELLGEHRRLLREAVVAAGGVEFGTEGDALFVAFPLASSAVAAAVQGQRALASHPWPTDGRIRVRMGLHTGVGAQTGGDYVGMDVHRAARIAAAGHGGQILASEATRTLSASSTPEGVSFRDLGEHRLKDLPLPERLYQVVADGLDVDFPPLRTLDGRRGNLPRQLTSFVGRRREIDAVKKALGGTRLLTLTGPGGTGKTRLSLQAAYEVQDEYEGGAFFVALSPISDPSLVATTIAQALGLREDPSMTPVQTVIDHLRDSHALLVLDNFEQVLPAAGDVATILSGTREVDVLVTSREVLRLHGEREFPVPALGLPDPAHLPPLAALSAYEAVALFIDRARAVRPDFEVTNENAPAVAEICARVDGLPLAIELAAARVKLLSPQAILGRLEHRLELLSGGARDLPSRQRTLRDAIAWSFDLLDVEERRLFARLSVFVGGASLEAIEAVCAEGMEIDTFGGVASLVDKSLLREMDTTHGEPRFFMLETIREFAAERLAELPDADAVRSRHGAHFLSIAEAAAPELFGPRQAELLGGLEREHANLRAALEWTVASGSVPMALRLGAALWRFWQMHGHLREAGERLEALLAHPDAEHDPEALAQVLEAAGGVAYWMGRWEDAERAYTRCLELRRRLGDPSRVAEALYNLAFVFFLPPPPRRDVAEARRISEEALEMFRELDDRHGVARTLWALSAMHLIEWNWQASYEIGTEAVQVFRALDDRFGIGWAGQSIGLAAAELGRYDEAATALRESLTLFAGAGDLTGIALLLGDHSVLEGLQGEHERASRLQGAALEVERQSGQGLVTNMYSYIPDAETVVRGDLSQEEHERLLDEGRRMSSDEAVAYALRIAEETPPSPTEGAP